MDSPDPLKDRVLVLFDGVCNLCNSFVQFVIRRDPAGKIRFASLQSDFGRNLLKTHGLDPDILHSVIAVEEGVLYQRSDAALRVANHLSGFWPIFTVLKVIPRFLRDTVYNTIASSRYRWFGRRDACMVPDASMRSRFVG